MYNWVINYNCMYVNQYKYIGMNFIGVLNNMENIWYVLMQGFINYNVINIFVNYDFLIGNYYISVMGGFNQEENYVELQWIERKDVLLSNLLFILGVIGIIMVMDIFNEYVFRGFFYCVNYLYKDCYMFEVNG